MLLLSCEIPGKEVLRKTRTQHAPANAVRTMSDTFLKATGLRFTYRGGKQPALDGVDLSLARGRRLSVMGRSGSGKSSLCLALRGLIPQNCPGDFAGEIMLGGKSILGKRVRELASSIGIVFQDFESQLFCTRVELEVAFTPQNLGLPRDEIRKRVFRCLELVGLRGFEKRDPQTLSGGEKQRLALAAVLAGEPDLLLLDEVTSDLDPAGKRGVLEVIGELHGGRRTILLTTHDHAEAAQSDSIALLEAGRIAAHAASGEILCQPKLMKEHGVRPREIDMLAERRGMKPLRPEEHPKRLFKEIERRFVPTKFAALLEEEKKWGKRQDKPIIEIENLSFSAESDKPILSKIDLSIREGEIVAIVGRNGAGKTTLIQHFNGLLLPTHGEVKVGSLSTRNGSLLDLCRTVGFVFQNPDHQIFSETVRKEVSFGPRNFGVGEAELEQRVSEALAAVHLEGFEEEDPLMLPKGARQKVAVASILAMRPQVLVLDEPTTGLDYDESTALMELLHALNAKGHTVVLVTHAMWLVARYAHRVVVLDGGQVVADTTPRELFSDSALLTRSGLAAPEITTLSNRFLGKPLLSEAELEYCMEAK